MCEAVVMKTGEAECELKNLATVAGRTGKRLCKQAGTLFVQPVPGAFTAMTVGTSEGGVAFYRRLGFAESGMRAGFFTNYDPPVYENGRICRDMILLEKSLSRRRG